MRELDLTNSNWFNKVYLSVIIFP